MAEAVSESEVMEPIEQAPMVEDFFNTENEELVDQDTGEDVSFTEDLSNEIITDPEPGKEPITEQSKASTEPGEPAKPEKKGEFIHEFYTDQGELDTDNVMDFINPDADKFSYTRPAAPEVKPPDPNAPPIAPDERPEYLKKLEKQREYRQNLNENLNGPFTRIQELVTQGHDVNLAIQQAQWEVQQRIASHMEERNYKLQEDDYNTRVDAEKSARVEAELGPKSISNINTVAQEIGGPERFNQLMASPEFGGPVLNWLYDLTNPDAGKLTSAEFAPKFNSWWTQFSSNINNLRMATQMAKATVQQKLWPDVVKKIRATADGQSTQNRAARAPRPSGLKSPAVGGGSKGAGDALDTYLHGAGGVIDQI